MKLNTRYALLALVITSARQTMTVQLTEEKRVTLPAWGRQSNSFFFS